MNKRKRKDLKKREDFIREQLLSSSQHSLSSTTGDSQMTFTSSFTSSTLEGPIANILRDDDQDHHWRILRLTIKLTKEIIEEYKIDIINTEINKQLKGNCFKYIQKF